MYWANWMTGEGVDWLSCLLRERGDGEGEGEGEDDVSGLAKNGSEKGGHDTRSIVIGTVPGFWKDEASGASREVSTF